MKVDYQKYPQVPPGCQLNENKKNGSFQVFKEVKIGSAKESGGRTRYRRISVGVIKNGVFTMNRAYELEQQLEKISRENERLESRLSQLEGPAQNLEASRKLSEKVSRQIERTVEQVELEDRDRLRSSTRMSDLALLCLMSALGGETQCNLIADYCKTHRQFFAEHFPLLLKQAPTPETVRRAFLLSEPKKFQDFYIRMVEALIREQREQRIICADGQAIRATGRTSVSDCSLRGAYMLMNIYDRSNHVLLCQSLIDKKTNEISVGPDMIRSLSVSGSVITADAMSCQVRFVDAVLESGADYLLSLKGNQDTSFKEAQNLFVTTHPDHLYTYSGEIEFDHGRVESRQVQMISGRFLSKVLKDKWPGLAQGSVVRVHKQSTKKTTLVSSDEYSYYITSVPAGADTVKDIGKVIRAHWSIENRLHWMLDMYWSQDRIQAKNPNYIANRSQLNKLALAFIENYRYWLWAHSGQKKMLSVKTVQARCRNPLNALECIACGLGLN